MKAKNASRIALVLCFFLFLSTVVVFGIPFLQVPSLFNPSALTLDTPFLPTQTAVLTVSGGNTSDTQAVYSVLQKRVTAFEEYGLTLGAPENNTICLSMPESAQADLSAIALQLTVKGEISVTDTSGSTVLPAGAIESAVAGYGLLSQEQTAGEYFISFTLAGEHRAAFTDITRKIADSNSRILYVNLDGSNILTATVTEPITDGVFVIGGNFPDSTLPSLYAAIVQSGSLDIPVSLGAVETHEAALSSAMFYALIWTCLAALLILCVPMAVRYKKGALPLLTLGAFYLSASSLLYTAFGITASVWRAFATILALVFLALSCALLLERVRKLCGAGQAFSAAVRLGLESGRRLYVTAHLIALFMFGALLILGALLDGVLARVLFEVCSVLLFAAAFSLCFVYWSVSFWASLFDGIAKNTVCHFGGEGTK